MTNDNDDALRAAIARFLPSVVRLALTGGINGRQFGDLVKQAYVDVVTADYGRSGRPTNIARTALITGLSRNDVKRIRSAGMSGDATIRSDNKRYGLGTLLREWHTNTTYLDRDGRPATLVFDGGEPSFAGLARRFFSDVPATTTLRELVEGGAVERDAAGNVRALRDYFLPPVGNVQNIERTGGLIEDFFGTVSHNLQRAPGASSRLEIRTTEQDIAARHEPDFYKVLDKEATKFYQRIERWLKDKKELETNDEDATMRLGFGVYQISGGGEPEPDE
ncbi:MAG: DUF6502 family protein [Gammaproteobacteria bacterium]